VVDPDRRRQLEADDPAWLRFYFPDVFYNPFTDDQLESIAECRNALEFGFNKCRAAPRGGGKSSVLKFICCKYALERRVQFPLIIAATFGKAQKTTGSLRRRLASRASNSEELAAIGKRGGITTGIIPNFLADDYPLECFTARYVHPWPSRARNVTGNGQRSIHVEWGADYFILPTWEDIEPLGPIIMALGYSSDELQGCNIYDRRPDALMLDDLDSRDSLSAEHGKIAGKIEEAIDKTIAGLGGQSKPLGKYMICTITSTESAAFRYSLPSIKPAWDGTRVAAIKVWPGEAGLKLWEQYMWLRQSGMQADPPDKAGRAAHQLYLDNRKSMDRGAVLSNPHDFDGSILPDGTQKQVSSLQRCFDYIADWGRESFDTEHQNDPPKKANQLETKVSPHHVANCAGDYGRLVLDPTTKMIVRGVDVRKIELHQVTMATDDLARHRIADYAIRHHGHSETTVQQAEVKILEALHTLAAEWEDHPLTDIHGTPHSTNLTLIDKGWLGSWNEEGETKTWISQPVETFCIARGLRNWLPAKAAPIYNDVPKPGRGVILGDNWHVNKGPGKKRKCDEVIWNAAHWHQLVEELFMVDDADRFELFDSGAATADDVVYTHHKAFGEHITAGATQMNAQRSTGTRSRKPRFVRDHWWDSCAMMLVAKSVEETLAARQTAKRKPMSLADMSNKAKKP